MYTKKKKIWFGTVFIFLLAISAYAGGGKEEAGPAGGEATAEKELHVFHFKVNLVDQWDELTSEYSRLNPGITFNNEIVGGGTDWITVLKTKFAAGRGPDVFVVQGPTQAREWSEYLTDLSDQPWVKNVVPAAKEPMTFGGKLMGMPLNLEGYGYIYNKKLFRQMGITDLPKTINELHKTAKKIQDAGITPFGNGYAEWWVIGMHLMNIPFAYQNDPNSFMADLTQGKTTFKENKIFQDFQSLFDLTIDYGNRNQLTTDFNTQISLFVNGDVAMIQQGNWVEPEIFEADPTAEVGFLPMPVNNNASEMDKLPVGVPFYFIVNSQSEKQTESKSFLNWMVSSDFGQRYITDEFLFIPAFDNIPADNLKSLSKDLLTYASKGKTIPWPFTMWNDGMYNEFAEHTQAYVGGVHDYQTMLDKMQASWMKLNR